MPVQSEYNAFRRLIGDFSKDLVDDVILDEYLDDATRESTADFTDNTGSPTPVTDFDVLVGQYHTEVIYLAAINWWWDIAAKAAARVSVGMGASSQTEGERWQRAMEMIAKLREEYLRIQSLGTDITQGNLSRFSKSTLTRIGGQREERGLA